MDLSPLSRYRPLIDDWAAFEAALHRPLPVCVRANTLVIGTTDLHHRLAAAGLEPAPVPWYPGAFRLPAAVRPGLRREYRTGLYAVQEEVSLLPAVLLAAAPGQRVLDLCAAPGSKTAAVSALLANRGTVIANDRDTGRLSMVRANLDRLGSANAVVTQRDAVGFPPDAGPFDRVLADVPCSCEGTSRKSPGALSRPPGEAEREKLARIQGLILRKALHLCRPGGRVVYSTCTYAPEENELVVDDVLRELGPARARVVPAALPGLRAAPGLTAWAGRRLLPDLAGALRVWPHANDTGGFFVAVLEKLSEDPVAAELHSPEPAPEGLYRGPVVDRFGLPEEALEGWVVFRANARRLHLAPADLAVPAPLRPEAVGLPFLHTRMSRPQLTSAAARLLGPWATQNVVELTPEQAAAYEHRIALSLEVDQRAAVTGDGLVLVCHQGITLGLGLARAGRLSSLVPKRLVPGR